MDNFAHLTRRSSLTYFQLIVQVINWCVYLFFNPTLTLSNLLPKTLTEHPTIIKCFMNYTLNLLFDRIVQRTHRLNHNLLFQLLKLSLQLRYECLNAWFSPFLNIASTINTFSESVHRLRLQHLDLVKILICILYILLMRKYSLASTSNPSTNSSDINDTCFRNTSWILFYSYFSIYYLTLNDYDYTYPLVSSSYFFNISSTILLILLPNPWTIFL